MPGAATFQVLFLATGREKSNHADRYLICFELLADATARHYLTQSDARANFLKASSSSSSSFAKNVSSVGCEKKNFAKKCRRPSPKIEPLPDLRLQVDRLALVRSSLPSVQSGLRSINSLQLYISNTLAVTKAKVL